MLTLISSIPTIVREGFDVQDLPLRATPVSVEQMSQVFGGCSIGGWPCLRNSDCCSRRCLTVYSGFGLRFVLFKACDVGYAPA